MTKDISPELLGSAFGGAAGAFAGASLRPWVRRSLFDAITQAEHLRWRRVQLGQSLLERALNVAGLYDAQVHPRMIREIAGDILRRPKFNALLPLARLVHRGRGLAAGVGSLAGAGLTAGLVSLVRKLRSPAMEDNQAKGIPASVMVGVPLSAGVGGLVSGSLLHGPLSRALTNAEINSYLGQASRLAQDLKRVSQRASSKALPLAPEAYRPLFESFLRRAAKGPFAARLSTAFRSPASVAIPLGLGAMAGSAGLLKLLQGVLERRQQPENGPGLL